MTGPVAIRKSNTGEVWTFPGDIDSLPAILEMLPMWGCSVVDQSAAPIAKEFTPMKPKDIIKRAAEYGDVDQSTLMAAAQARACKAFPDATEPVAFAKYVEKNPEVMAVLKAAPPAPAPAAPRSSYEAICMGALEMAKKSGTSLPPNSPYLPYLKATEVVGNRDGADPDVIAESDKALKNVAQSLVDSGKFTDLATSLRYVRSSPKYRGLAGSAAGYRSAIREGDAGMRRAGWR